MIDPTFGLNPAVHDLIPRLREGAEKLQGLHVAEAYGAEWPSDPAVKAVSTSWVGYLKEEAHLAIYLLPSDPFARQLWLTVGTHMEALDRLFVRHSLFQKSLRRPDVRTLELERIMEASDEIEVQDFPRSSGDAAVDYVLDVVRRYLQPLRTEAQI